MLFHGLCSSAARAGSSLASSMIPPYQGSNARARGRVQALQAYYQQHQPTNSPTMRTPIVSGTRRSNSHRGSAQSGQLTSSSDQIGFVFIPSGPSGHSFQEEENHVPSHFHAWERDRMPSTMNHVDRDNGWGAYHQAASGSDPGTRSGSFRLRNGSERLPSQNR